MTLPELCFQRLPLAAACVLFASSLMAQTTPPPPTEAPAPTFDVATIRLHEGILTVTGLITRPDGIRAAADTLADMMTSAYSVRTEDQVSGGPAWVKSDRYDIEAKMSADDTAAFQKLSPDAMKERRLEMLCTLLEDRFRLQTHIVTKEIPVYELVVTKGGPKMKDAANDTNDQLRKGQDGKPLAGIMQFSKEASTAQGYTMGALASLLSQPFTGVGRPVNDKTGLTATYNFTLDWSPQMKSAMPGGPAALSASSDDAPSIFTALQDLGLKLQPAMGPEQTIVIDHVERPTEN